MAGDPFFADIDESEFLAGNLTPDQLMSRLAIAPGDRSGASELGGVYEPCRKCGGSGRVRWGVCFACQGKGGKTFKNAEPVRAANRAKAADRREAKLASAWDAFAAAEPDMAKWLLAQAPTFAFAGSIIEAVKKWGGLTDGQRGAVDRCMARDAERTAARTARVENAPTVDASLIADYFARQIAAGKVVSLKLRFKGVEFSPAGAESANPGAIYAKAGGRYLGKIKDGRFITSRDCQPADVASITSACAAPLTAAKAYGMETKRCCVCGASLTDPVSRANGIGPICAAGF